MHEALCAVVAQAKKKERCCCCRSMAHLRSGWRADAVAAADATPKSPVFGPARGRETERFMPRVYITSISRMILYINSTSANICPALMNSMDFLIRSLSLALFLEERQRHQLKLIRQTSQGACVSVIYFVYLFIEIDVCNICALGCRIKLDTLLSAISFLMPEWCKN